MNERKAWRKTSQTLAPAQQTADPEATYRLYPGFHIDPGKIKLGFHSLAKEIARHQRVVIDGYGGVLWDRFRANLAKELTGLGYEFNWIPASRAHRSPEEIETLTAPFLGGQDPLFGTRFTGKLVDFFDTEKLKDLLSDPGPNCNILYGTGAALAGWDGFLVYVDLPKNEIQFRSRAGSICNLGAAQPGPAKEMYKRFYFVDWVALNDHKSNLLPELDLIVDEQRPDEPAWMEGEDLRQGLREMANNYFRVRPWFEPGPWGGHWIQENIPTLPGNVPNYAWSFELITPENGLVFESGGLLLEVSFDFLMFQEAASVLGRHHSRFGIEFPIRYDFLDTFDGGNLSIQVHPRTDFIKSHFGESFTQDETYYILDSKPGAQVYLGFRAGVDPEEFRRALEKSFEEQKPLEIDRYVLKVPSRRGDLFLIPGGTIHGSGKDNLVLEISATPYIFTFKMYDWMRPDLEGKPRPLNIDRAFKNLVFERQGQRVQEELISRPVVIGEGDGWRSVHLPTHPEHFYDVNRLEFDRQIEVSLDDSCHILMVVEGKSVLVETLHGCRQRFNYAETFVIPAAANSYRLINLSDGPVKVVKTFLKPDQSNQ